MDVKEIPISDIELSECNMRKDLTAGTEDGGIEDLAGSIKERGLLNPIIVRKMPGGGYELIAGQRRFLACQKLGYTTIPAIIRDFDDDTDAMIISLVENVHRADMSPLDKARAYQKIYEKYGNFSKVAKETGVSVSTISKYISLLKLAPSIQERLTTAEGPARISALAKIAETYDPEDQEEVLDMIGGFRQDIQLEMIKRSDGNPEELIDLRDQALEGAFDIETCKGLDDCPRIPPELIQPLKEAIRNSKKTPSANSAENFKDLVRKMKR